MSHHERLKALIAEHRLADTVLTGGEIAGLYAEAFDGQKLYPAQHANAGKEPFCRQCRQEGALLEVVNVSGSAFPSYRPIARSASPIKRSQHEWLEIALSSFSRDEMSRDELRQVLTEQELESQTRDSLLSNLSQHMPEGTCRVCRTNGYLLESTGRNQYRRIQRVKEKKHEKLRIPEAFLRQQLAAREVIDFLEQKGVWTEVGTPFINHFFKPIKQAIRPELKILERLRNSDFLVQQLWKSNDFQMWEELFLFYQEYVQEPAIELIFHRVLHWHIQHEGVSSIKDPRFFFYELFGWFIGGSKRKEYEQLLKYLKTHLPNQANLRWNLKQLESLKNSGDPNWLEKAFEFFPKWMGWDFEPEPEWPQDITGIALTSVTMTVLWPETCWTISTPLLDALNALHSRLEPNLPLVPNWNMRAVTPRLAMELTLWSQAVCRRKNRSWKEDWLTPRKLDMLLYTCRRHLADSYKKHLEQPDNAFRVQDKSDFTEKGKMKILRLFGSLSQRDLQLFEEAYSELVTKGKSIDNVVKYFDVETA